MSRQTPFRIAFIHGTAEMAGVEFSTLYLINSLDRKHWHPIVICPSEGRLPSRCRELGVQVVIVPIPAMQDVGLRLGNRVFTNPLALLRNAVLFLPVAWRLAHCLRTVEANLVCTKELLAQFYGGLAARWVGIPCVWHLQDYINPSRGMGLYPLITSLSARVLASQVITDGKVIADQLHPKLYPPGRVSVVYNGVNTDEFSPSVDRQSVRSEFNIADDELLIGCVGRFTVSKGQSVLIQAMDLVRRRCSKARLLLVGSALFSEVYYESELRKLVMRLNLQEQVIFAGYRADLPQVLAALDVFVFPSVAKDTSPLALTSALASGKPVVATKIPGILELFAGDNNDTALLVSPNDAQILADVLGNLLDSPELRYQLGQSARRKAVAEFSVENYTNQCQQIFLKSIDD